MSADTRAHSSALLHNREFRRLWAATTTSQVGSAVTLIVLPLIAVVSLDATPSQMGLLYAAGLLPTLLVRLPAAAWADTVRWGTPILVMTDLTRAVAVATIPVLWWLDLLSIGTLLTVVIVSAALTGVQASFYSPLLLGIVPRVDLPDANGKLLATRSVVDVGGPGVAGMAVSVVAAPVALLADAASFLVSAGMLWTLKRPPPQDSPAATSPRPGTTFSPVALGRLAGSLIRQPAIVVTFAVTAASAAVTAMQVLFMVEHLDISPSLVGPILGLGAAGGVVGGLLLNRLSRRLALARVVALSVVLVLCSFAPLLFCGPGVSGIVASVNYEFAGSVGGTLLIGVVMTSVQTRAKPGEISRTIALAMMFLQCAGLTGALLGGVLADVAGVRTVILAACLILVPLPPALWLLRRRGAPRDGAGDEDSSGTATEDRAAGTPVDVM